MSDCKMCGGLGWTLDSNNKVGPSAVEFIPCFHPECETSGQTISNLVFKGVQWRHVSLHPREGWVMSVSDPTFEDKPQTWTVLRVPRQAAPVEGDPGSTLPPPSPDDERGV